MQLEHQKKVARQSLAWIGQAVSGILLIVIVLLHMYFHHFQSGGLLSASEVMTHVSSNAIFILEILFILFVTYHAMLGVRAILFDLKLGDAARRRVTVGLTLLGVVTAVYGVILAVLIRTQMLS
jgi:succinate dehydrogenase hydrophobic anchor subunit